MATEDREYNFQKIEAHWQSFWETNQTFRTSDDTSRPKYYVLDMFPYPSGSGLHIGHPEGYTATDIVARYRRARGCNVLHPIGWDAFGLPAEQHAVKTGAHPRLNTEANINNFRRQLKALGFSYDWNREVNTTDPDYYRWTQWIFLEMWKKGLAFESNEPVNWCPTDKTVLANEDVENGRCERCGTLVEKRPMRQWVLKITDYADRLLNDLDAKDSSGKLMLDWPEAIKESQRNWIGRSEGALIKFKVKGLSNEIEVFTTRPDTLFGVTYVVLAPEHKLVNELLSSTPNKAEVDAYISNVQRETEIQRTDASKEKTGVELKGVKAINPANNEEIPVWIADYVLADYGTGAVMAVPAHDDRDWAFAKKFKLSMKLVIEPLFVKLRGSDGAHLNEPFIERKAVVCVIKHWSEDKYLCLKWKKNDWQGFVVGGIDGNEEPSASGTREIHEETGYKNAKFIKSFGRLHSKFYHEFKKQNRFAHFETLYFELQNSERDEMTEEDKSLHEVVWVPKREVLAFTSKDEDMEHIWKCFNGEFLYVGDGILTNSGKFDGKDSQAIMKDITGFAGGKWVTKYKLRDWVFSRQRYWGEPIPVIHCPKCGVVPVSERDLPVKLPKVESYEPTGTGESPLAAISKWVNVKCPKCGGKGKRETNTMPQWAGSSWYYLRYEDPKNSKALVDPKKEKYWSPVDLYVGGAEHATRHLIYARFWHKFLYDIGVVSGIEPFAKLQSVGLIMGEDGRKMSKRFGNVVNPDDIVKMFGADTLRIYEMFMGPFDQAIPWSTDSIVGSRRFIERVWKLAGKILPSEKRFTKVKSHGEGDNDSRPESHVVHKTIKKVTEDIETLRFNTAISTLMIALNELDKSESVSRADFESYLKLVAPFAPHVADELWTALGNKKSIHISPWPTYDPALLTDSETKIILQVNGKVRGSFMVPTGTGVDELGARAKSLPEAKKWLTGKTVQRVVTVVDRLVNIVVV